MEHIKKCIFKTIILILIVFTVAICPLVSPVLVFIANIFCDLGWINSYDMPSWIDLALSVLSLIISSILTIIALNYTEFDFKSEILLKPKRDGISVRYINKLDLCSYLAFAKKYNIAVSEDDEEKCFYQINLEVINDIKPLIKYDLTDMIFNTEEHNLHIKAENIIGKSINYTGENVVFEFVVFYDSKDEILGALSDTQIAVYDVFGEINAKLCFTARGYSFLNKQSKIELYLFLERNLDNKYLIKVSSIDFC